MRCRQSEKSPHQYGHNFLSAVLVLSSQILQESGFERLLTVNLVMSPLSIMFQREISIGIELISLQLWTADTIGTNYSCE